MTIEKTVNETVYKVIGSCMDVQRTLGPGYHIDLYRKALEIEFKEKEMTYEFMKMLKVTYKDIEVGETLIDFLVNEKVIVAVRVQPDLTDFDIQTVLRCLKLADSPIGILVSFGSVKINYRRILPSRPENKEIRREALRPLGYREMTREMGRMRDQNPTY
jgi:GxxExxY protein